MPSDEITHHFRELRREYRRLAREHFGTLRPEDQALILGWIDAGPDLEIFRRQFEEWEGRPPTEEDRDRFVKGWQLDHLAPIAEALPDAWKERYAALVANLGPPSDFDFTVEISAGSYGPTSPMSADEFRAKPVDDIIEYLKGWEPPPHGFMAPSREGVGRALTEAVASDPGRFLSALPAFREVHPIYVRSLLEGISKALAEERPIDWAPVLDLCQWVAEQPRELSTEPDARAEDRDEDPDWSGTRQTIARLLLAGLESKKPPIPIELRNAVWAVLRPLTDDPDPTAEREAGDGGTRMDPPSLAINSVRGDAMHAVIEYARWLNREFAEGAGANARAAKGFEEMAEVREVLERHLEPAFEASAAIRSVYGRYLPWLIVLDKDWVVRNLARIFPDDPALSHLRDAVWETYIVFCPPYNDPLAVLRDEYRKAIDRIGTKRASRPGNPDEQLGDHLMAFYWRGKVPLDEADGLLQRFYAKADAGLRRDAIELLGRSLGAAEGEVEADVRDRLVRLWKWRVETSRASGEASELETFGWWFASEKLDEEWLLAEVLRTIRMTKHIDPDFLVLKRLRELAPRKPKEAIECIRLMVEGSREPWDLHSWREEMEKILRAALESGDDVARTAARELVNLLAARGHLAYRGLLNP